jgi:hypothetical protein
MLSRICIETVFGIAMLTISILITAFGLTIRLCGAILCDAFRGT